MTDTIEQIDLSSLIDFDSPVLCASRLCREPGETAIAMVIYTGCSCRIPIGLNCVLRIQRVLSTFEYSTHSTCTGKRKVIHNSTVRIVAL